MSYQDAAGWSANLQAWTPILIGTCGGLILAAVLLNFLLARRPDQVQTEKKSPVATTSMILFFVVLYWVVHARLGVVRTEDAWVVLGAQVLGWAMIVKGTAINLIGRIHLGLNWANQATVYREQKLVTNGLYRWIRHPLYAGLIVFGSGIALAYLNWLALLLVLTVFRAAMVHRAELEEEILVERFPEYAEYQARTGRFYMRIPLFEGYRPMEISRDGFRFCRWSMAGLVWAGVVLHLPWLVLLCAAVMAVSAIVTVRNAPMVTLYRLVVEPFRPSPVVVVDSNGLRLAHIVASVALSVPIGLISWGVTDAAILWRFLLFVAAFKTLGALGFCPVSRMFTCMIGGGSCCRFLAFLHRPRTV